MSKMRIQTCYAILVATVLLLSASSSKAEVFTTVRFTRIGGSDQVIAVPTTFYLVPRYRPRESRSEPETWQVRLRNRNGSFTRSYQVGNSGLAIQRARRAHPDASILAVRKR